MLSNVCGQCSIKPELAFLLNILRFAPVDTCSSNRFAAPLTLGFLFPNFLHPTGLTFTIRQGTKISSERQLHGTSPTPPSSKLSLGEQRCWNLEPSSNPPADGQAWGLLLRAPPDASLNPLFFISGAHPLSTWSEVMCLPSILLALPEFNPLLLIPN